MGRIVFYMNQLTAIAQAICWVFGIFVLIKAFVALDIYIRKNKN